MNRRSPRSVARLLRVVAAAGFALLIAACSRSDVDKVTFHNDRARSGWTDSEVVLTPARVSSGRFGLLWRSPAFDAFGEYPARLYASPLYLDRVDVIEGEHAGGSYSIVFAVASTGYAYAVNAFERHGTPAGTILWRTRLTSQPCLEGRFGNISTPVIDRERGLLYVTSCDAERFWSLHALDVSSGAEIEGWPVSLGHEAINRPGINANGPAHFRNTMVVQRGALALNHDNSRVYVTFGPSERTPGWIVAVDVVQREVASAFSTTANDNELQGGIWASSGPAIDAQGRIHVSTGSSKTVTLQGADIAGVFPESAHNWGQSILQFSDDAGVGLRLIGTYTPFNYCRAAAQDADLGSSGVIVVDVDRAGATTTPRLLVLAGGKQGNAYLLDRDNLPGDLTRRPPCSDSARTETSLLAPESQPHLGGRGPLNIFGVYSQASAMTDGARSRSTAAWYRDVRGDLHVFATGNSRLAESDTTAVPPSLIRLGIVNEQGEPSYLRVEQSENTQTLFNPGSPIVTSNRGRDAIVWVLDTNAPRTAPVYGPSAARPVLYAFDARNLDLLWRSADGELFTSGKYNEPTVARGVVFVGTDRIEAFGLRGRSSAASSIARPGVPAVPEAGARQSPGELIFQQRCASCHQGGEQGAPEPADLRRRSQAQIVEALTTGPMRDAAAGLSGTEIDAVAIYIRNEHE